MYKYLHTQVKKVLLKLIHICSEFNYQVQNGMSIITESQIQSKTCKNVRAVYEMNYRMSDFQQAITKILTQLLKDGLQVCYRLLFVTLGGVTAFARNTVDQCKQ